MTTPEFNSVVKEQQNFCCIFVKLFLKFPNDYAEILSFVRQENTSFINESASYRIATDGAFLFKSIETEKYKFYFRNPVDSDFEKPFAFLYKFID